MRAILGSILLLLASPALAQETRVAPDGHVPPAAALDRMQWLAGQWAGEGIGGAAATVLALSATLSGSTAHLALTGGASAPPALVQDAASALLAGGAAICCRDGGEALAASLSGLLRAVVKAG